VLLLAVVGIEVRKLSTVGTVFDGPQRNAVFTVEARADTPGVVKPSYTWLLAELNEKYP
jgi:hypothetical protein